MNFTGSYLISYIYTPTNTWTGGGGSPGNWSGSGNWGGNAAPNGAGQSAYLGDTTGGTTVTLDAPVTLGSLILDSATSSYAVGGTNALTIQDGHGALLTVQRGSHAVSAPVTFATNTTADVEGASNALTLSGGVSLGSGVTLLKQGAGTLTISGPQGNAASSAVVVGSGTLALASDLGGGGGAGPALSLGDAVNGGNGGVTLSADQHVSALNLYAGGKLDVGTRAVTVNYGSGNPSPAAAIRAALVGGYHGGDGAGTTGITSANAAATPGSRAVGYADGSDGLASVPAGTLLVRYTVAGDADLDGACGFSDLSIVLARYGTTGDGWAQGDFNYDGQVNFTDLSTVLSNYGTSLDSSGGMGVLPGTTAPAAAADPALVAAVDGLYAKVAALDPQDLPQFASLASARLGVDLPAAASVPEPGSVGVLGAAAGLSLIIARRRRAMRV